MALRSEKVLTLLHDTQDPTASALPVEWALGKLHDALDAKGWAARKISNPEGATKGDPCIVAAGWESPLARRLLEGSNLSLPDHPGALALVKGKLEGQSALLAAGSDARGLTYALLELTERIRLSDRPSSVLNLRDPLLQTPANPIRSVARFFVSEVEDKPWFYDRSFWGPYLDELATQRFNRFSLTLGIGYDFLKEVRDSYLHFAYPFLVDVPGYDVRATGLPDEERERNLDTLQYIAREVARRGLHFQLGLWTHGYDWSANEGVNYFIEGLNPENHAAYCRDALRLLLEAVPEIGGVTFRIHGESGVPEGTYAFWRTVFRGIEGCGRAVEIDMHAKGIDPEMIDVALETGMPVNVSPKYSAEHMMLPYQQASIRASEMPPENRNDEGFFAKSGGSRRFLRYSYGDLLKEDRRYGVLYRMWPGTQRLLLWGDPEMAAAYSRAAGFCGSAGMELCEPLSFKGRKGSGHPWGREAYADESLKSSGGDWKKYEYSYRLWGRLLYEPDAPADSWRRYLKRKYGAGARPVETALGAASHILPLVTTAHHPSAANNNYWPEIYTNMSIVDEDVPHPYGDTPKPKRFGTVCPLDPALFAGVDEAAAELLSGDQGGKITPMEVAAWLERFANRAMNSLSDAEGRVADPKAPDFKRLSVDVAIQAGLGRFFAHKLRAGVLYEFFDRTGQRKALKEALEQYRSARTAWVELSECAKDVYTSDITFGRAKHSRGHWADRLPAIDEDLAAMEQMLEGVEEGTVSGGSDTRESDLQRVERAIRMALKPPSRPRHRWDHTPPSFFRPGQPVKIEAVLGPPARADSFTLELHYRHVNQGGHYQVVQMRREGDRFHTLIPGDYTNSPYPLIYFFVLREGKGGAAMYPGFNADLTNVPYFVVRQG